jgi:hypothetical protein
MTDTVQIAVIVAIPPTIAALGAIFISWRNGKKTDELKITVDGRLTELLESKDARERATAISSHAQGVLDEKERQQQFETDKKKGAPNK